MSAPAQKAAQLTQDQQKFVASIPATKTATERFVWRMLYKVTNVLFADFHARIAALEKAIAAIEHKGVWEPGVVYERGNNVTFRGSAWTCKVAQTTRRPADDNSDWQLIVRKGRDGRDAA